MVVGDDALEAADVAAGPLAVRPWPLGHRERLLQHLGGHWGLDHCFKHEPTAIVNLLLTSFIAYALLQAFYLRNLKPAARTGLTLIGLARELDRGLVGCRAPWAESLARAP